MELLYILSLDEREAVEVVEKDDDAPVEEESEMMMRIPIFTRSTAATLQKQRKPTAFKSTVITHATIVTI